jgi:hypothetical protein
MYDELKLVENNNPLVRLVTYGKIKKTINQFQSMQINTLEQNMMRSVHEEVEGFR